MQEEPISVIIPCFNEGDALHKVLEKLNRVLPQAEIIVVDDGSSPPVAPHVGATIIRHPTNLGNGAAIKTGARVAHGDLLVFMDADGQHDPDDIPRLLEKIPEGYAMVVGARSADTQASWPRRMANAMFNRLASAMTGFKVLDLTSGFRVARARFFKNFLYLLPNGFSYPTTSTMAMFRCGHPVAYVPIRAHQRTGRSKIRMFRDGVKFLVIILRIGTLFSPMRFFLPLSLLIFAAASVLYGYTFYTMHRFTNMSAVLYLSSLFTLLFGIVSEQVSALHYRYSEERRRASDRPTDIGTAPVVTRVTGEGELGR